MFNLFMFLLYIIFPVALWILHPVTFEDKLGVLVMSCLVSFIAAINLDMYIDGIIEGIKK